MAGRDRLRKFGERSERPVIGSFALPRAGQLHDNGQKRIGLRLFAALRNA